MISYDPEQEPISVDYFLEALRGKNIEFGIDHDMIHRIVEENVPVFDCIIARGIPHENGKDAEIQYFYSTNSDGKPAVREDGTVDFKNIGFLTMVKQGTVIARKTPPTMGTPGTTVTGKTIAAKPGRDKPMRYGKHVALSEDGLELISEIDGKLTISDGKASVSSVIEIKGDVGIETGNIEFVGNIVVNGDVNTGYEVRTDGDIVINGSVGGGTLIATGNITVSRGIQGQDDSRIECGGNLVTNFINDARVKVGGDLEANIIMNSEIRVDGKIELKGKKGQLLGGDIVCKGDLEAKVIGSELEIVTVIKLGIDAETLDELRLLTLEIRQLGEESARLGTEVRTVLSKLSMRDDPRLLGMLSKHRDRLQEISDQLPGKQSRQKMLQALVNNMLGSRLKAGELYPGTRVRIGTASYYVKFHMLRTLISREQGEISATGY